MNAKSGSVFQKSPKLHLLKEKSISHLLNDYSSKYCIVRRDSRITTVRETPSKGDLTLEMS